MAEETAATAPSPTTTSTGAAAGGNTGTVVTLEQLAAIEAALAGSVATFTSQAQAQMASLTENINKISQASTSDTDTATVSRSSIDPAASQRRMEQLAEASIADSVAFRKACDTILIRKLSQDSDHQAALPPVSPRSSAGPGTTAS